MPLDRLIPMLTALVRQGLVAVDPPGSAQAEVSLTERGRETVARLLAARRDGLAELLAGWSPERHLELAALLRRLARELLADDARLLRAAEPGEAAGGG
jgi:DNA-binding MarR family transcriptional regulator